MTTGKKAATSKSGSPRSRSVKAGLVPSAAKGHKATRAVKTTRAGKTNTSNPLLASWRTPFAIPPFQKIAPEHFEPALNKAFAEHRAEIRSIETFDSTQQKNPFALCIVVISLSMTRRVSSASPVDVVRQCVTTMRASQ